MNAEWDIRPPAKACLKCEVVFADQQPYFTRLTHGPEGYARVDYCEPCWRQDPQSAYYSYWRGIFRQPPSGPDISVKRETAESLLRSFMEKGDASSRNVIYILAVMLERRRVLSEKEVRDKGGVRTRVYEHRETGEVFLISDPQLRLDQLGEVQQEVAAMLSGNTDGGGAPAAAPPAAPASPEGS
jgi:hypothetical protein